MQNFKKIKKIAATVAVLCVIIIGFTTCKKYPEGGFENRGDKVIFKNKGQWLLTLYEVNGIDSTNLINYNGSESYKNITFFKESRFKSKAKYCRIDDHNELSFDFSNNNETLTFYNAYTNGKNCYSFSYFNGCYRLVFTPELSNTTWKILKLTKKEIILECTLLNNYLIKIKCR